MSIENMVSLIILIDTQNLYRFSHYCFLWPLVEFYTVICSVDSALYSSKIVENKYTCKCTRTDVSAKEVKRDDASTIFKLHSTRLMSVFEKRKLNEFAINRGFNVRKYPNNVNRWLSGWRLVQKERPSCKYVSMQKQ